MQGECLLMFRAYQDLLAVPSAFRLPPSGHWLLPPAYWLRPTAFIGVEWRLLVE